MRIVEINTTHKGSTGKIMLQIANRAREQGHQVTTFSTQSFWFSLKPLKIAKKEILPKVPGHRYYGSYVTQVIHTIGGILTGGNGQFSIIATAQLLRNMNRLAPDIIHLHNLHGFNINLPMLFHYIKKHRIPVVWTLHDCWAVTGHCAYFDMAECEKWKTQCYNCPQYRGYPASYLDNSRWMHNRKKKWFVGVENLTIVTPSAWLAGIVKQSYLNAYPIKVIYNGIDTSVFSPTPSDFRKKYHCEEKFLLLGVADCWGERKGLDVFIDLAKRLDEHFQIILVGTDEEIDRILPENIISIHHTQNQKELAEIYTVADLFVNPTREEVLGLVNTEALACGIPVVTFNSGGSPECVDATCGAVVPRNNIDALEREIIRICEEKPYPQKACFARAEQFKMEDRFDEYVALYEQIRREKECVVRGADISKRL